MLGVEEVAVTVEKKKWILVISCSSPLGSLCVEFFSPRAKVEERWFCSALATQLEMVGHGLLAMAWVVCADDRRQWQ